MEEPEKMLNQPEPKLNLPSGKKHIPTFVGIVIIVVVAVLLFGGVFSWQYLVTRNNQTQNPIACTMEAKICPDGSAVGRTGPNCEFTKCPDLTAGWQTYTSAQYGFEFKYPVSTPEINIVNHSLDEVTIHKYDKMPVIGKITNVVKEIIIGGKVGYEYDFVSSVNYKIHGFMISLDSNHYLEVSENSKQPKLGKDDWDKIISTFKFTTPQTQNQTAGWETYTNTKYGFEFKYPSTLYIYSGDGTTNSVAFDKVSLKGSEMFRGFLTVRYERNKNIASLDTIIDNMGANLILKEKVIVNRNPLSYKLIYRYENDDGIDVVYFIVIDADNIIIFDRAFNRDQEVQQLETMFSTFKFTTPTNQVAELAQINFSETGNIVDWDVLTEQHTNNWKLIYEKPGRSAIVAGLLFNQSSACNLGTGNNNCSQLNGEYNGKRAKIEGFKNGDNVIVKSLILIN